MPTEALRHVLAHLRGLHPDLNDGQLLARFAGKRDEDAFAVVLRRHGGLVWGVCRGVLGQTQDAEDAFQGTFLALARKANALSGCESVGGWLYRVASRTALHARAAISRRCTRERSVGNLPDVASHPAEPQDWHAVLHEEIAGLPDVYRQALVLCELEGVNRREGAHLLGIPEGTLSSRLAAARRLLGKRLVRRGMAFSIACLAGTVPEVLAQATVKAVTDSTRVISVVALVKGVLPSMVLSHYKALLAVAALACITVGAITYPVGGQEPTTKAPQPETKKQQPGGTDRPAPNGDELVKAKAELEALRRANERLLYQLEITLAKVEQERQVAEERRREAEQLEAKARADRQAYLRELTRLEAQAQVDGALNDYRKAKDKEARLKALESVQKALDRLKENEK
jgi:RNA polymerase sigma factor (sigma-70 family)